MDLKPRNGAIMKDMQEFEKVERPYVVGWGHHVIYVSDYDALLAYTKEIRKELEQLHESFANSIEARSRGL